jgi:hypothetical protein
LWHKICSFGGMVENQRYSLRRYFTDVRTTMRMALADARHKLGCTVRERSLKKSAGYRPRPTIPASS